MSRRQRALRRRTSKHLGRVQRARRKRGYLRGRKLSLRAKLFRTILKRVTRRRR